MALFIAIALASPAQESDYFPFRAGNEWTYGFSNGGAVTVRVIGTEKVKGQECWVVESEMASQKSREYLALGPDGIQSLKMEAAGGTKEFDPPLLRAKLPYRKGDTWQVTLQEGAARNTYQYEWNDRETITIAGASVECLKATATLKTPQGILRTSFWYGRGLGLVKQVSSAGPQTLVAELKKTNVKPAPAPGVAKPEIPVPPGEAIRYESKDGKVVLYHPRGWKVAEGAMFGEGTYSVTLDAPDESAGVLFITFALNDQLKDSVDLAKLLLSNLSRSFPTLKVPEMTSTQDRSRTTAAVTFTQGEKKVAGHLYIFHTRRAGTVYALLAREDLWPSMRPTLTQLVANLAYAPEGVAKVLQQGLEQAASAPRPGGDKVLHPAAMIKEALARGGKTLELVPAVAQDGSFSMSVPRGWTFQGANLGWVTQSDPRLLHGACSVWHTIYLPGTSLASFARGSLKSRYLPPAQAMAFITQSQNTAKNLRVLSACAEAELDPSLEAAWAQARAQGSQVDSRLLLVEFENVATGQPCRGIFSVASIAMPMGWTWSCSVGGSWAPASEYEDLLPTFAKIHASTRQNEQWVQGKFAAQAAESQRLNRNLMNSIKDLNHSYDRYNQSWWERQKSHDYTSWAFSQTTLGQGSWVSEREGAVVVKSDSWGLKNTQTGEETTAWNHTSFTGRNPWTGEQLNEVNTRAEYEKYIRGR